MTEPTPEPDASPTPVAEAAPADPVQAKLAEVAGPFVAPIPGQDRAGENARFDDRHEAIRNEVDKLGRPEAEELDWGLIEEAGRALLTEKSKDYLIACYFGVAAYVRRGPPGLIEGLVALCALLEHYWDDGFPPPKRVRARINAIDWFVERVGMFRERAPIAGDRDDFRLLSQAAKKLQDLVLERFQDDTPNIYGLKDTLERIELAMASQPDTAPQAEQPQQSSGSPEQASATSADAGPASGPTSASMDTQPGAPEPQPVAGSAEAKIAELALPFISPIPGGARAGENARYDDQHQAIRNEVEKLGKPTAEEVDWDLVHTAGRELLTTKSKDILIASYFGVAAYVKGGVEGLVTGLAALSALLRNYWDDGFPPSKRIRARVNAIDWFIDRVESLGDLAPKSVNEGNLHMLSLAAKDFESLVLDRFQDESPNIHRLKQTLERIELALAKQAPPPPPPPASGSTAAATAAAQPAQAVPAATVQLATPTAQLTDPAQVNKFLRDVGESIHKASRALFKASKEDPLAYRLCRQGLYMSFQQAPPATNGNQTMVPPPPADRESHLNALLSAQNWPVLLDEAESGLAGARLWLDQHRYVALALAGLGHEAARETVVAETSALMQRLPGLQDRAFSDGQPFASGATRDWLGSLVPGGGGASMLGGLGDGGEAGEFEQGLAEAQQLALGGKLGEAVDKLNALIDSGATSRRDKFRAKLTMADACAAAGSPAMAEGILAGLSGEIAQFRLQEWEPKLAEACYRSRYEALTAMAGESAKSRDDLVDVYRQLCEVAPAAALKLGKPPG